MTSPSPNKYCIILAAGVPQKPIEPYTNYMPKCFLPVNGKPVIHHTLRAFLKYGVKNFVVVTGAHADHWNESNKGKLQRIVEGFGEEGNGDSGGNTVGNKTDTNTSSTGAIESSATNNSKDGGKIYFVNNTMFWNNGPSDSLRMGHDFLRREVFPKERSSNGIAPEIYVCYGDVVFTEVVLEKLVNADRRNAIVVDRELRLRKDEHEFGNLEVCIVRTELGSPSVPCTPSKSGVSGNSPSKQSPHKSAAANAKNIKNHLILHKIGKNIQLNEKLTATVADAALSNLNSTLSGSAGANKLTNVADINSAVNDITPAHCFGEYIGLFRMQDDLLATALKDIEGKLNVHNNKQNHVSDVLMAAVQAIEDKSRNLNNASQFLKLKGGLKGGKDGNAGQNNQSKSTADESDEEALRPRDDNNMIAEAAAKGAPFDYIEAVGVFGNWREIHSAPDLGKANSEMHYLNNQEGIFD